MRRNAYFVTLSLALLLASCGGKSPLSPLQRSSQAGGLSGTWQIPVGGSMLAFLNQNGQTISGYGYVDTGAMGANCWHPSDRLQINGTVTGSTITLNAGTGVQQIHLAADVSTDGDFMNGVRSVASNCVVGGQPWSGAGTGFRVEPLAGTYDVQLRNYAGQSLGTIAAELTQSSALDANAQCTVNGRFTSGPDLNCDIGTWTTDPQDFRLVVDELRGKLLSSAGAMSINVVRTAPNTFSGYISGLPPCIGGQSAYGYANVTVTKH